MSHRRLIVGCTPGDRDALDARAVSDAVHRTGGYIDVVDDLGVAPFPAGTASRILADLDRYPVGHELGDTDGDGLSDLEEWIYGL